MKIIDYDIRPIPRSYMRRIIDLYIKYQDVGATDPGFKGWRIARQFSHYWDRNNEVMGCFDKNDDLVGFIAWIHNHIDDPYRGVPFVEFDEEKGRYVRSGIWWHEQLLVVPKHRGNDIGRTMMNTMLNMVNGRIRNICHEEWLVKFYESFGFENIYHGQVPKNPDQLYWINERRSEHSQEES